MTKTIQWSMIGLALIAGFFFRFWDLSWHFAHIDDIGVAKNILDAKHAGNFGFWSVASSWTYAPFQFWFTSFLLNLDQSYREILFWGRLPSAVFSSLVLILFLIFYIKWKPEKKEAAVLPLTLLACSWENIIFAKQMNNYALGVVTMCVILICLFWMVRKSAWKVQDGILLGLVSGMLVWLHYQVLFILAPLIIALFFSEKGRRPENLKVLLAAAGVQLLFVLPLFPFLEERLYTVGLSGWNQGPHNEFLFSPSESSDPLVIYIVKFFFWNFCLILRSMLAFLPENKFSESWGIVLAVLFFIGLARQWIRKLLDGRVLVIFVAAIFAVWISAAMLPKVTLSPTRHSLIFTPLMVLLVSEGWFVLIAWIKNTQIRQTLTLILCAVILFTTLFTYDVFLKNRRDPFVESQIAQALKEHPVDAMFRVNFTNQVSLMKSVRELFDEYDENTDIHAMIPRQPQAYDRIAWVSHRDALNPAAFESLRLKANIIVAHLNKQRRAVGLPLLPEMKHALQDYNILYQNEIRSEREIEYSRATRNGSNNLFFYILEAA